MTQEQKDYIKLLKKIKNLPETERKQVDAFAMGLVTAIQIREAKTA